MDAIPVKHFIKHISELYSNNQHGFSEDFEVSRKVLYMQTKQDNITMLQFLDLIFFGQLGASEKSMTYHNL